MGERLADRRAILVVIVLANVGQPGTETITECTMEAERVAFVGTNREGGVSDTANILEAVAELDEILAVAEVATNGGRALYKNIRAAEIGRGTESPAVLVTGDASGAFLTVGQGDVARELGRRSDDCRQGHRGGGRSDEGEETEGIGMLHIWGRV